MATSFFQGPVVQKMDSAIYPLVSDLSGGFRYPPLMEQLQGNRCTF